MQEIFKLLIGIAILILGVPIGDFLAKNTKEELDSRKNLFKTIILTSLIFSIVSLILQKDFLLFGFLFVAIITSRSLFYNSKKKVIKRNKNNKKHKKNGKLKRKN